MKIRIAVGVADLLVVDLAEPVIGGDGAGVGQNQPANGIGDGGVLLDPPVRHPQIVIHQFFIVQHGGAHLPQLFPVFPVEDVGLCHGCVSGALQHRLHAVLNVLHADLVVANLADIVGRYLKNEQIDDIRIIGNLRRVKGLGDGLRDARQVKIHLSAVPFDYLIHMRLSLNASQLCIRNIGEHGLPQPRQFISCMCLHTAGHQAARVYKRLEKIAFCPLEPAPDLLHLPFGMQRPAYRSPEFIICQAVLQQKDAFLNPGKNVRAAACFRIAPGAVLDVHRHIVKKAVMKKNLQHSGIGAVGVQLDGIAKITDSFKKLRQLRLERRLPAGDADTVQFAPAPLQICKHLRLRDFRPPAPLRKHQVGVMAVWAAQIAAGQKYRTGDLAGIIQQRQFLHSANAHGSAPPFPNADSNISVPYVVVYVNIKILHLVFCRLCAKRRLRLAGTIVRCCPETERKMRP